MTVLILSVVSLVQAIRLWGIEEELGDLKEEIKRIKRQRMF